MSASTRPIAADSSSLILLQKCELLDDLLLHYAVRVSVAVFEEISLPGKAGAEHLAKVFAGRQTAAAQNWLPDGMDRGEGETVALYRQGAVDFILVDDKKAAQFCRRSHIPFINSLLLPRILNGATLITNEISQQSFSRLMRLGFYSPTVIDRARRLPFAELRRFYPH